MYVRAKPVLEISTDIAWKFSPEVFTTSSFRRNGILQRSPLFHQLLMTLPIKRNHKFVELLPLLECLFVKVTLALLRFETLQIVETLAQKSIASCSMLTASS